MSRIEDQFRTWRDEVDAIDGAYFVDPYVEFPEFDLYNKAFRLKNFGLCPKCGSGVQSLRDVANRKQDTRCEGSGCGFTSECYDTTLVGADDPDDIILDIVRTALA